MRRRGQRQHGRLERRQQTERGSGGGRGLGGDEHGQSRGRGRGWEESRAWTVTTRLDARTPTAAGICR